MQKTLVGIGFLLALAAGCGGGGGGGGTPVSILLTPGAASVFPGDSQPFVAQVQGAADTRVTWSIDEGAGGGSVTGAGLYTAPAGTGIYHLVATSVADPSKQARATVTVAVGTAAGTIR